MLWSSSLYIWLCLHFFFTFFKWNYKSGSVETKGSAIFRLFIHICWYKFFTPKRSCHFVFAQIACEHACLLPSLNSVPLYPTTKPLKIILFCYIHLSIEQVLPQHILCAGIYSWVGGTAVNTGSGTRQTRLESQLCLGPSVTLGMFLTWAFICSATKHPPKRWFWELAMLTCTAVRPREGPRPLSKCWCLSSTSL